MSIANLTQQRVDRAGRKTESYIIHDRKLKGFGLRVRPSGRKTYEINITRSGDRRRETVGDAASLTLKQARAAARNRIAAIESLRFAGPETPFETMAELAMRRMERLWKPGTMETSRSYLRNCLLPFFTGKAIGDLSRRDVEGWFAGLSGKQGAANRSAKLLSVIFREAEAMGARPELSNPVRGLRLYRRPAKERTLTRDEMARLGVTLEAWRDRHPLKVALVELLILTGCRVGELVDLHWRDYRNGHLHLPDSKTGPKPIFLCSRARAVLDGINTPRRGPVFPTMKKGCKKICVKRFWINVRNEASLNDVRLHDLRHHYASTAVRLGVNVRVLAKLLGHNKPETTMRYAHPDDMTMRDAANAVGGALSGRKEGGDQ